MENLLSEFDFESVLSELNKSNEGKDIVSAVGDMNSELEASSKRVEEYILKHTMD